MITSKPFHFEELLERVRVQLRAKAGEPEFFHLRNNFYISGKAPSIKDNVEIPLTQKEFALLEYLVRNKNKNYVDRTLIIEKYGTSTLQV
jgi:DNA-binding response OmpR family regulator